jgi:response regulator RpfG family c-di-GMP phosphodiesterase
MTAHGKGANRRVLVIDDNPAIHEDMRDGIETAMRIWELDPRVQIVICSAYSDHSWESIARRLGHSDRLLILKKPFDNIEVLQVASALTEKWRLAEIAKRRVQDLETQLERRSRDLQRSNALLAVANEQLALQTERANERVAATDSTAQAQGFHFSKAVAAAEAGELLRGGRTETALGGPLEQWA